MTYNPNTGRIRCSVCGSKALDRPYYTYQQIRKNRVRHICGICIVHGAYWCTACEDVHSGQDECLQQQIPWSI